MLIKEKNMQILNELYMEDVGSIALQATEVIQEELRKLKIELTPEQEDLFYVPIFNELEKLSNCNYRREM
jgi:hypothetical protein